jgi:hypothetical protein
MMKAVNVFTSVGIIMLLLGLSGLLGWTHFAMTPFYLLLSILGFTVVAFSNGARMFFEGMRRKKDS